MPKNQSKIDDKNYRLQMQRLDKEILKTGKRLYSLRKKKAIQSSSQNNGQTNALKDIRDKIRILEREHVEKVVELLHLDSRYKREVYRRKHCPIPSKKCPICPIHPAK